MPDKDSKIDRRNVLKGLSSAGLVGIGASMSVSVAAADGTSSDPITILEGREKLRVAGEIKETRAFADLLETATELGYEFEFEADAIDAGRVEADTLRREVVAYELEDVESDARAGIIIGRNLDTHEIEFAQLDVEYYYDDGLLEKVDRYELSVSDYPSETGLSSAASTEPTIEKREIRPDEASVRQFTNDLQRANAVTPAQSLPDLPDELNINSCSGCYYASKLICRNVCGAFGGFLCGLLGITVVGPVGCVAFVKGVCWVAERASGCGDDVAATLCKSSGLGVCGPDADGDIIDVDIPYF
ncbi:halocin C8-like domain-containing protein [Natrinema sp. H-ect1]|uniref:halocin C8-like domain-containing protein n=1 Tax=Natrinema sp. H-ect1 TaxID=3242700 RepID=UPI00359EA437